MYIQSINNSVNFKSKPKYLSSNISRGMVNLKTKFDSETIILKTNISTQVINVRGIEIQDKAVFKDGKFLAKRNKQNQLVPYGKDTSMLEFGSVRIVVKDNGEIIERKKPFFKRWADIYKQAEAYIQFALDNYGNESVVKKITQKKEVLTSQGKQQLKDGYNKIMDAFNKINPFSGK